MSTISKYANLTALLNWFPKKERDIDEEDKHSMTCIVGHTSQEEFSRIINGNEEESKSVLFYILSNLWTYKAVINFWNEHLQHLKG